VSHDGIVLEKDLGPETYAIALTITAYGPDSTWIPVKMRTAPNASEITLCEGIASKSRAPRITRPAPEPAALQGTRRSVKL
jgi:hypothetical protein